MGSLASSTLNKGSPPKEASLPVHKHLYPVVPLPIRKGREKLPSALDESYIPQVSCVPRRYLLSEGTTLSQREHTENSLC